MKKYLLNLLVLIAAVLSGQSVLADTAVLSTPTDGVSTLSDAKGVVTITDSETKGGIQAGSVTIQGVKCMKLSGTRLFNLTYSSDYTITSVKLYGTSNKTDATSTVTSAKSNGSTYGTLPLKGSDATEITLPTSDTGLYFSVQSNVVIVVEYKSATPATEPPTISTDLPSTADVTVGVAQDFSISASNVDSYQWYAAVSSESTEGATAIEGATSSTYSYTADAVGTAYLFCAAKNDVGTTNSTICTITAKLSAACQLSNIQFSNTAYGSIIEHKDATYYTAEDADVIAGTKQVGDLKTPEVFPSITVPYLSGSDLPSINVQTLKYSDKATYAISDDETTLTVTAEDGTTTTVYSINKTAITPLEVTANIETTKFTEVPSWVYNPYGWDSTKGIKFSKSVDDASNMRIAKGNTRQYYFIGAAKTLSLTSYGTSRDINVYVNGKKIDDITASGTSTIDIPLNTDSDASMVCIESNQTSGDGGFTSYAVTFKSQTSINSAASSLKSNNSVIKTSTFIINAGKKYNFAGQQMK